MHIKLETSATSPGKHGFADSELPLDSAPQDINDIIKEDRFDVTLSVSKREVRTKTDGGKVIEFEQRTINTADETALVAILTSRNYSTNQWNGTCSNANYIGMTGVTLDFDDQLSLEGARQRFAPFNYILHTSSSHGVLKNGQVADRFRVILPYEPGGLRFCTIDQSYKVYDAILKLNPEADPGCKDPGRKYFPHTNELGAEFILEINNVGKYFDFDISGVPDKVVSTKVRTDYLPPAELNSKEELDRMMKFCPFMQWCQAEADNGLPEPLWYAMISNLCRFTGGRELIHKISAADPVAGRYDFDATVDKIRQAFENSGPIGYETIVRDGWPGVAPAAPLAPAGWAKLGRIVSRAPFGKDKILHIRYDDDLILRMDHQWRCIDAHQVKTQILDISKRFRAVCLFCDDDNANIRLGEFHFLEMWCDRCHRCHYEHPDSPYLFCHANDLARVETRGGTIASIEILDKANFRTNEEFDHIKRVVVNDNARRFLSSDFQIRKQGAPDAAEVEVKFNVQENAIDLYYPPIGIVRQDNSVINSFLEGMFGEHAEFIKNWMAVYAFTNYRRLAVIALGGDRFAGKGTFANLVGKIYPKLFGHWDGDVKQFNPEFTSKLLFVDENRNSDKPTQYTELKRITGSETIAINDKFKSLYYVPNNINLILATNDAKPVALKWGEEPRDEHVNNFFIYKCKSAGEVDNELGRKLEDCLGWYVRSELRERYDKIVSNPDPRNRYVIPTPITEYAKDLYLISKTSVEEEAEELAEVTVRGLVTSSVFGNKPYSPVEHKNSQYIMPSVLRRLIKSLGFSGSKNVRAYVDALVRAEVITAAGDLREDSKRLGHKILRDRDFYPETGPVIRDFMTVDDSR